MVIFRARADAGRSSASKAAATINSWARGQRLDMVQEPSPPATAGPIGYPMSVRLRSWLRAGNLRAPAARRCQCDRRPAHRRRSSQARRSAHDAGPAARVRAARCDRRLPPSPRGAPRRGAGRRAHPGQHQARVRLLTPGRAGAIARPSGLILLTLEGDTIAAITWFADTGVFPTLRPPSKAAEPLRACRFGGPDV